jgi:hypothetical protein
MRASHLGGNMALLINTGAGAEDVDEATVAEDAVLVMWTTAEPELVFRVSLGSAGSGWVCSLVA